MKRKVLCAFSLIVWVLTACTILSLKIEEQMTARVVTASRNAYGSNVLPLESLSYDGTSYHLFEMVDGSGWESGPRARELDSQGYSIVDREYDDVQQVMAAPSYNAKLIQFSSRPLRKGELLEELPERESADDVYLAVFPKPVPEFSVLPTSMGLEGRTETALLLSATNAAQPFLEARARDQLYQAAELRPYIHPMAAAYTRVYSLRAVEQFMEGVPRLALLLVMLLFPVVLWVGSCVLLRKWDRGGWLIPVNIAIAGLDAVCMACVLGSVALPSSLLPADMIFDFGHYTNEFGQIFDILSAFGDAQITQSVLHTAETTLRMAVVILSAGFLFAVSVIMAEGFICRIINKKALSAFTHDDRSGVKRSCKIF